LELYHYIIWTLDRYIFILFVVVMEKQYVRFFMSFASIFLK